MVRIPDGGVSLLLLRCLSRGRLPFPLIIGYSTGNSGRVAAVHIMIFLLVITLKLRIPTGPPTARSKFLAVMSHLHILKFWAPKIVIVVQRQTTESITARA